MPQNPGPYKYFDTLTTPAESTSAHSLGNMYDYTQASGINRGEAIIWTSLCQAEEPKCTHTDRKWHLRDKNLFCVSTVTKKSSPWPKQAPDFHFYLKVTFQFVYLCLADILL